MGIRGVNKVSKDTSNIIDDIGKITFLKVYWIQK